MVSGIRAWVERNPVKAVVAWILIVAVCMQGSYWVNTIVDLPLPPGPKNVWFLDLGTGQRFVLSRDAMAPVESPSGLKGKDGFPGGVRLHVFTCGQCREGEWFDGFLERFTPEGYVWAVEAAKAMASDEREPGGAESLPRPGAVPTLATTQSEEPQYTIGQTPAPFETPWEGRTRELPMAVSKAEEGRLVARVDKSEEWHSINSEQGRKIVEDAYRNRCPKRRFSMQCFPPD